LSSQLTSELAEGAESGESGDGDDDAGSDE